MTVRAVAKVEGLPEAMAALAALELRVGGVTDKALQAVGDVVAEEWKSLVPIQDGNYQRAIGTKVHRDAFGASGDIGVRHLDALVAHTAHPENEQPYLYASRLEYGGPGVVTVFGRATASAVWRAFPSARPAYDRKHDEAVAAGELILAAAVMVGTI